ncbi:MAG: ribonuclease PH [Planctomycetes bacterium]|nr:ribonuclease PH [Planctomycetota bacterium]
MRADGRGPADLRPVSLLPDYTRQAEGAVLAAFGDTKVICTASVENEVPKWMVERSPGAGWITAEYAMLPGSTRPRKPRERQKTDGRSVEIQRLIGRALRAVVDRSLLGERQIVIDCDVIQADGGTRTAAITGGYVALRLALDQLLASGAIARDPVRAGVAAVSVGLVNHAVLLDLSYEEDARAEIDATVVMTSEGRLVEVHAAGEGATFPRADLDRLLALADAGIRRLTAAQEACLLARRGSHSAGAPPLQS